MPASGTGTATGGPMTEYTVALLEVNMSSSCVHRDAGDATEEGIVPDVLDDDDDARVAFGDQPPALGQPAVWVSSRPLPGTAAE